MLVKKMKAYRIQNENLSVIFLGKYSSQGLLIHSKLDKQLLKDP